MAISLAYIMPFCLILASINDAVNMKIPNKVILTLLGSFPLVAFYFGIGSRQLLMHLAASGLILLPGFVLYLIDQVGAGDVKLLSASALWFGLSEELLQFLILASVFGALLVLIVFAARLVTRRKIALITILPTYVLVGKKVPYGIAICCGGLIAFPNSVIMQLALDRMPVP